MASDCEPDTLLVCNCRKSMTVDAAALAKALGRPLSTVHTELCRSEVARFETAIAGGGPVLVACMQESALFSEIAGEKNLDPSALRFVDIRERAGWGAPGADATPKMAALLAEAAFAPEPARLVTLESHGVCLVYGAGAVAIEAAREIAGRLSVSVLLSEPADAAPADQAGVSVSRGVIRKATGRLGKFSVEVDGYAPALPSSRDRFEYDTPRNGAKSSCDLIIDLSGRPALFSPGARRDGYLRADPKDPAAVMKALLKATDLVGEFEKPRYVAYDAGICAHKRSEKVGCRKCLDVCPTGAITPDGDHVAIDVGVCAGCGTCSAVCPTGAADYAYPQRADLLQRMQILLSTYRGAGGTRPSLLIHDRAHGGALIAALARHGDGLPVEVIPLEVHAVTAIGHDTLAAGLALGAAHIVLLAPPEHPEEIAALEGEFALAQAFLDGLGYAGTRLHLTTTGDPEDLGALLHGLAANAAIPPEAFAFAGTKRDIARTVLGKLHAAAPAPADRIALPKGAPYGRIAVRTEGCTLCLACVGACPANALADHPDRPELSFTEAACVQCGICVATCPERVIALTPGYDFTPSAFTPHVVKSEEPFHCIECGKAFGTKSTIERVTAKLEGRHAMFRNQEQLRLIRMCDTCRVVAVSNVGNDPMRLGERPRVITTDDYLAARADSKKPRTPDDFLS